MKFYLNNTSQMKNIHVFHPPRILIKQSPQIQTMQSKRTYMYMYVTFKHEIKTELSSGGSEPVSEHFFFFFCALTYIRICIIIFV